MRLFTKYSLFAIAALTLAGCISLPSGNSEPRDESYYLMDYKKGLICLGNTRECLSLSIVASQNGSVGSIESAYQQKVVGPNYPRSLQRILMFPADKSYKAQSVNGSARFYQIPKNDKTDTAWRTLNGIFKDMYN